MAYVYSHTRLDKNEVFYIGIGSDELYKRAFTVQGRNRHWYSVVKKTDYKVDILYDNMTWEEVCIKEIELIKQLGRINEGGILVNITEGGEGFKSNHSQKTKDQIRDFYKGKSYEEIYGEERANTQRVNRSKGVTEVWKNRTLEDRRVIAEKTGKPVLQFSKNGIFIQDWPSISQAGRELGILETAIHQCLKNKCRTSGGFIWKYKENI